MKTLGLFMLLCSICSCSIGNVSETKQCFGNLETYDKQVIQAGVSYKIHYEISGSSARVEFAGREFDATAEKGNSWKGLWIKKIDGGTYFSYLPEESGVIKFQFEPQKWFSGNC